VSGSKKSSKVIFAASEEREEAKEDGTGRRRIQAGEECNM